MSNLVKRMDLRRAKAALPWMPRGSQLRPHPGPMAVPSARPAPFLRAVRFALLALALGGVLLWSAPAEAQTTTVLIKNTAQTSSGTQALDTMANNTKRAQAFTTGANSAGYTLSSIGFDFASIADITTAGDPPGCDAERGQRRQSRHCAVHADRPGDLLRIGREYLRCADNGPVPNAYGEHDVLCRD